MTDAHIRIDTARTIADIDRRLFGGFVEHMGRHIYTGIFEPGHPTADENGFRTDVVELVKELGVTTIRYPGGNFVSGYRWEDGVGPIEDRPRRLDLAWHSTETNRVGLHEFSTWLELVESELMLAVNLGTRGVAEALDLLEYVNVDADTQLTRRRADNRRDRPFGVSMWCLGNEMDGFWQLGHLNAEDYGKLAARTAKAMRMVDPTIQLVASGSSGRDMPTFGEWERTVLEHAIEDVDFISCHAYYQERNGDAQEFLASGVEMARFIESIVATADAVSAAKKIDKRVQISFDEWNIWYLYDAVDDSVFPKVQEDWPEAPRLIEDKYSVLDAVVFGDLLITLLQHCDRVRSASLAQLVNVIAPIMTEPGGPAWRQTTFFPFAITSRLGRGRAMRLDVRADTLESKRFGAIAAVNAVATLDDDGISIFLVNRSLDDATEVRIDTAEIVATFGHDLRVVEAHLMHDDDLYARNTLDQQNRVSPKSLDARISDSGISITLPKVSWAALRLSVDTTFTPAT